MLKEVQRNRDWLIPPLFGRFRFTYDCEQACKIFNDSFETLYLNYFEAKIMRRTHSTQPIRIQTWLSINFPSSIRYCSCRTEIFSWVSHVLSIWHFGVDQNVNHFIGIRKLLTKNWPEMMSVKKWKLKKEHHVTTSSEFRHNVEIYFSHN